MERFVKPDIEIIDINSDDIIMASSGNGNNLDGGDDDGNDL